ncbi:DUF11 domain-containing protein [Nonomuraea sp. MG754425]|nr:DUF11 domain-containing protein [Nonomuraea sp. MG754425]
MSEPLGGLWRATAPLAALILVASGLTVAASAPAAAAQPATITMTASAIPPPGPGLPPPSSPVASGSQLTYTIDVANTSGAGLDEVVLTDQVQGMTGLVLTSSVGTCSESAGLVTCRAGSLDGGQPWRVTIRGIVTAANGETLHNTATVAGTHASQTFAVSSTVSTLVSNQPTTPQAELSVSIQGPAQIGDDQEVRYDLTVNNAGGAHATDVVVIDTLPNGFEFVSAAGTSLFTCENTPAPSLTVTCKGGRVNAGTNATITVIARSGVDPGPFDNTAVVDPYGAVPESNELNNTGSLVSNRPAPPAQTNLTITKTDLVDPIRPGDVETFRIHVVNTAATRADDVVVVDGTQGLDAASVTATTTKGTCTVEASKVTCTQRSPSLRLDPGESLDVTITGKVVATAGSRIVNTATVTGNIKNTGVSNSATTTTTVRPGVDLSVVQTAAVNHSDPPAPDAFRAHDSFDYVIAVGNSGLDDARNVVVREPLVDGTTFKSFKGPDGVECGAQDNVVTCTGLTVRGATSSGSAGGTVETITVTVVAAPKPGKITSTVTVDPANAIREADETNNSFATPTDIATGVDLTVMADSEPAVAPSGTLVYTITVFNIGTQDTEAVTLQNLLPAGVRFREAVDVGNHNFTCTGADGAVNCIGGILRGTHDHTLAPDFATIKVTLFAPAPPALIKTQVRMDHENKIAEMLEDNNINIRATDIRLGGCCVYHDLTVDKRQVYPDSVVAPSGMVEYDVIVSNTGTDVAFHVNLQDIIPAGASVRFAEDLDPGPGAFECNTASPVVCVNGVLDGSKEQTPQADDATRVIRIGLLAPTRPDVYTNQAIVDFENKIPEGDETNNSDEESLIVDIGGDGTYIDLTVDVTQSRPAGTVAPAGQLQYAVTVRNTGAAVAFNVGVRDLLPAGAVFRAAYDSRPGEGAFTCQPDGVCTGGVLDGYNNDTPLADDDERTIVFDVFAPSRVDTYVCVPAVPTVACTGTLDGAQNQSPSSGQTATITIKAKGPSAADQFSSLIQARVDPANTVAEADETNNTMTNG